MAKKTATKNTTETVQVAAPVPAPVTEKKTKKASTPAAAPAPAPAPEPTPVSTSAPETVSEPTNAETDAFVAQSGEFVAKLQQLNVMISALKTEYKTLERKWSRELKQAQKASSKRKRKAGARKPSGFVKPTKISDELASFLGKDKGTEMART